MWILVIITLMVFPSGQIAIGPDGNPKEHRQPLVGFESFEKCEDAKKDVWKNMDAHYKPEERKLYRFECVPPQV